MNRTIKRLIAVTLAASMMWVNATRAMAMLAPVESMAPAAVSVERTHDLQTVQTFLERKEVRQHLAGLGMNESEIQQRLGSLTDTQLHHVASQIDKQHPAGDGAGIVVTVLIIGVLALLFVYLLKRV